MTGILSIFRDWSYLKAVKDFFNFPDTSKSFISLQSDLKAATDTKGGQFYKEHLPILGESDQAGSQFKVGDRVRVDLEVEVIKTLQNGHGGWNEGMTEVSLGGQQLEA